MVPNGEDDLLGKVVKTFKHHFGVHLVANSHEFLSIIEQFLTFMLYSPVRPELLKFCSKKERNSSANLTKRANRSWERSNRPDHNMMAALHGS